MKDCGNMLPSDVRFILTSAVLGGGLLLFMLAKLVAQVQSARSPDRDPLSGPAKEWVSVP